VRTTKNQKSIVLVLVSVQVFIFQEETDPMDRNEQEYNTIASNK
jgi:hypothetical protein